MVLTEIDSPGSLVFHHLASRAGKNQAAVMENRDLFGKFQCDVHIMFDHDDRHVSADSRERLLNQSPFDARKTCQWLIEKKQSRFLRERHGQFEPSPIPVGRPINLHVSEFG